MDEPLHELKEVADHFKVTTRTIRNWIAAGRVRAVRVGRKWFFRESEIRRITDPKAQEGTKETS